MTGGALDEMSTPLCPRAANTVAQVGPLQSLVLGRSQTYYAPSPGSNLWMLVVRAWRRRRAVRVRAAPTARVRTAAYYYVPIPGLVLRASVLGGLAPARVVPFHVSGRRGGAAARGVTRVPGGGLGATGRATGGSRRRSARGTRTGTRCLRSATSPSGTAACAYTRSDGACDLS